MSGGTPRRVQYNMRCYNIILDGGATQQISVHNKVPTQPTHHNSSVTSALRERYMTTKITFGAGAHASAAFTRRHLQPLFTDGTITRYPGATYYAICYGELCAYKPAPRRDGQPGPDLLAIWSVGMPDCKEDVEPGADYKGEWMPYPFTKLGQYRAPLVYGCPP